MIKTATVLVGLLCVLGFLAVLLSATLMTWQGVASPFSVGDVAYFMWSLLVGVDVGNGSVLPI